MELEYLIIYTNYGIPIYSRCFATACKTAMGNDILFSAFLSSLNQFASLDPDNVPDKLVLNDVPVTVEFNAEDGTNSITLEDLQLIFFYSSLDDITIAAAFNSEKYDRNEVVPIFNNFLRNVEQFLGRYSGKNWGDVRTDDMISFERDLLENIVHPFFNEHGIKDTCALGENCPFRIALYENQEGTIFDRLRRTVERYRSLNIFQKLKKALFGSPYPLT